MMKGKYNIEEKIDRRNNSEERIFDFDIYLVDKYEGVPQNFEENDSMWMNIDELLAQNKKIPSIEIVKYLYDGNIQLKINSDDNLKKGSDKLWIIDKIRQI